MTAEMKFLSVSIQRDDLDLATRRRGPLAQPKVLLRVATAGGTVRSIELDRAQLGKLLEQAASAAAVLL